MGWVNDDDVMAFFINFFDAPVETTSILYQEERSLGTDEGQTFFRAIKPNLV